MVLLQLSGRAQFSGHFPPGIQHPDACCLFLQILSLDSK